MTDTTTSTQLFTQLATELKARVTQVHAAVDLLDGGATVPFIARYRKEVTGGLDDTQLRLLEERLAYLRELQARRTAVIASVKEQGKLTDELLAKFASADTKQALEDLYLPFKPKRVTKAMMARAAGLEPLADALLADPTLTPLAQAERYVIDAVKAEVKDAMGKAVDFSNAQLCLDGARDILSERWAEDAALLAKLRDYLWAEGLFTSTVAAEKATDSEAQKFRDYFEYSEPIGKVPSHRALAVFRGRTLGFLEAKLTLPQADDPQALNLCEGRIANHVQWQHQARAADDFIKRCVSWAWKVKLSLSLERELFTKLREQAEEVAIKVFGDNMRDLLLAAPAGAKVVMGLDPGIRTGVKVAVVDKTGKVADTATVYPHEPRKDWEGAVHTLTSLCKKHGVELISIGNGTASRETDKLAGDVMKLLSQPIQKLVVSEAGASVYSASEYASQELPDLDVSLRGAVSIARRVQDPLAELVKIEPKSIGVGQYQHDVNQLQLAKKLDAAVEDCVNSVGVDVNTASAPLLSRVAGLSANVARAVVRHRDTYGAFASREALRGVTGLGDKTFEQAAGFLRVMQSANPLDASAVHPESYPLVEKLLSKLAKPLEQVMGKSDVLKAIKPEAFADEQFGIFTVRDVLTELEKPGRDPRPSFKVAKLADGVEDITDLRPDMMLEGTVTNVAAFGAFIDIGVHQDGLVHVSQLADRFVSDAREVVKAGDIVKVRVVEVDVPRKRIALTMKLQQRPMNNTDTHNRSTASARNNARNQSNANSSISSTSAMVEAFAKLKR
jgi:protein Tex